MSNFSKSHCFKSLDLFTAGDSESLRLGRKSSAVKTVCKEQNWKFGKNFSKVLVAMCAAQGLASIFWINVICMRTGQ